MEWDVCMEQVASWLKGRKKEESEIENKGRKVKKLIVVGVAYVYGSECLVKVLEWELCI